MSPQAVCAVADADPGSSLVRTVANSSGAPVTVVVVHDAQGRWHALGDSCSHGRVSLGEGEIDDCTVECWMHGSRFDLETGRPVNLPAVEPVPVYQVTVDAGQVLVDVDSPLSR